MNKIQVLIDNGFITQQEVMDYVDQHYAEYVDNALNNVDHMEWPDDDYNQMINDQECEEQEAHELTRDYSYPEYVVASTSDLVEETMVFPSNEQGEITDYGDLACLALRYGHADWEDPMAAVITLNTDEYKYIHVKTINGGNNIHNLFRRINTLENIVI